MAEISAMLSADAGDGLAARDLLPLVYEELRFLAARRMAQERSDHTLQPTALVHAAYLRLMDNECERNWNSKGHFFAAAAQAMRRILIDHARSKLAIKRGGDLARIEIGDEFEDATKAISASDLLELDDALEKLSSFDPDVANLVKLRVYAGLSLADAAAALEISRSNAYGHWNYALAWFAVELSDSGTRARVLPR